MEEPSFGKLLQLMAAERKSKLTFGLSTLDVLYAVYVSGVDVGSIVQDGWWGGNPSGAWRATNYGQNTQVVAALIIHPGDPDMFDKLEKFYLEEASAQ